MYTQTDISDYQNPNAGASSGSSATMTSAPKMLVHEFSPTEFYIGIALNSSDVLAPIWSIRKIVQVGDVWAVTTYPDGDPNFKYIWADRLGYTYS